MFFKYCDLFIDLLPIVKSIIDENLKNLDNFSYSNLLLISIAYSSSIGGMATPIGTIPNAVFIGFVLENYEVSIDFRTWFFHVAPLVLILITMLMIYIFLELKNLIV